MAASAPSPSSLAPPSRLFGPITVDEVLTVSADFCDRVCRIAQQTRRIVLTPSLTLTFESRDSVLAMLHSIMLTEGMTDRAALQAECDVYNLLLPGAGGLCACLELHPPPGSNWQALFRDLANLQQHVWLVIESMRLPALFPGVLASRQHIRFAVDASGVAALAPSQQPAYLVVDHPLARCEVSLAPDLQRALTEDF